MDAANPAEIEVLFWIVFLSLGGVLAAIVALVRSGRAVPLPTILRLRRRTDESPPAGTSSGPGSHP